MTDLAAPADEATAAADAAGAIVLTLPPNTDVYTQVIVNAAWQQRITITPPTGQPTVFTGSGEHTTLGQVYLQTGKVTPYQVRVLVEFQNDGTWQTEPSQVTPVAARNFEMSIVTSEDSTDDDYNDSVCMFMWWLPPT